MLHAIQASLKAHIEKRTGLPCVWIYDGVTLPATRPIASIEALPTNFGTPAKLKDTISARYRFQIGIVAKSGSQAAQLPYEIADLLTFEAVPLLDTANGGAVIGEIDTEVTAVTPMPSDQADTAQKHKTYIDVTVARWYGR